MANYIEDFNSKLDWAMPFQRTGKFPIDRTNLFSTYNDAVAYAKGDGSDSRGLGGTSYVGQLIVVFENDVVTAYKINANRTIEALTSSSGVDAEILDLQTQLNSEIAARKAVDGQNGQTYVANTSANYINDAASLNDADIKLDAALKSHVTVPTDYDVVYPTTDETGGIEFINTEANDTVLDSLYKIDNNLLILVEETLKNEKVVAATLTKHNESAGFDENANYVQNTNATFIYNATTLSEADNLLDSALKSAVEYLEEEISNLGDSSSSDLDDEVAARKAVDGQSGQTYAANASTNYINDATSLNDADIKLDAAIQALEIEIVSGTELTNLGTNIKEAYKLVDIDGVQHGDYVKIYKDSSLKSVELSGQSLVFTYIYADGTEGSVPVDVSVFLAQSEFKDGLQVNANGEVSVKIDSSSDPYLTVSENGIKLSGVSAILDNLNADITSDDTALVQVQVQQTNGKITDVVVIGNDIDCGTF